MATPGTLNRIDPTAELDSAAADVGRAQARLLDWITACDVQEMWLNDGCRDMAQWISARLHISNWSARRWIGAAYRLRKLPHTRGALESGRLSLDKIVELCRFATPETEEKLIKWAEKVTPRAIRRKADLANRPDKDDVVEADKTRYLQYWYFDDGRRFGIDASLPAEEGAQVAKALDHLAGRLPDIVTDDDAVITWEQSLEVRLADALVAMASREIADDQDPDRSTLVVHADLDALLADERGCEIEGGPVIHPETARRLSCDSRLQVVLHDGCGNAVGIGRASRTPPRWLRRQLRHRDGGCTFPGCPARFFLHAHHILHWIRGGLTDLDNLVLVCTFHHKLVHEYGWSVELDGITTNWFRPGGRPYEPKRSPPQINSSDTREEVRPARAT